MRRVCMFLMAATVAIGAAVAPAAAMRLHAATIVDIVAMTQGPDGNVWFAGGTGNLIGRVSRTGSVTLFKLPFLANPRGIAPGPGGALYFSEHQGDKIGRITTSGKISQITLPTKGFLTDSLTHGPNNTLWFVDGNDIGELNGSLKFHLFRLPPSAGLIIPQNLTVNRYGNVWFTDFAPYKINGADHNVLIRLTPQGTVSAFPISYGGAGIATGLTVGPDGNLWYILTAQGLVGKVTPSGQNTLYTTPKTAGTPSGIVGGPNQSLWLACTGTTVFSAKGTTVFSAGIEVVSLQGKTRDYPLPPPATGEIGLSAITVGSDGNLWFPELTYVGGIVTGATIDRMTPTGTLTRFPIPGIATPAPGTKIPVKVQLGAQVQRGSMESIAVQTATNAQITMQVTYPQSGGTTATGMANSQGVWQYSWQVNAVTAGTATVKLTVQSNGATRHFTKHFVIL